MSKGGTTTIQQAAPQTVTQDIPDYIEDASRQNLALADQLSNIGYVPYYGADVAAFTPMQQAGFENTQQAAGAFGMSTGAGQYMPEATQFAGGAQGYSSAPLFEQSVQNLQQYRPAQAQYMDTFFMNPVSGVQGANVVPEGTPDFAVSSYTQPSPLGVQAAQLGVTPQPQYQPTLPFGGQPVSVQGRGK